MTKIPANNDSKNPDWELFEARYKKDYPEKFAEKLASGEWDKVKLDFTANLTK